MGLLDGKRILVTGVLTEASIAYSVAEAAIAHGAEVKLTGAGRGLRLTERMGRRLPGSPEVLEFDVTNPEHVDRLRSELEASWGRVDGALHAIGFAPPSCLGGQFMDAPWEDVAVALQVSAYSLKTLADVVVPLMTEGGSIVGLDLDAAVAWPVYDWMGVAKAALESCSRYMARELGPAGVRVNLIAAGPIRTVAARAIPGFDFFENEWDKRAPIGWDVNDPKPVAGACVALFSDLLTATTGEILHVDGGVHAVGA